MLIFWKWTRKSSKIADVDPMVLGYLFCKTQPYDDRKVGICRKAAKQIFGIWHHELEQKTGKITHEDSNWLGQMLIVPLWQVNDICDDLRD